jgi:hypothetical protein
VPAAEQPGGWFKQGPMSESSLQEALGANRTGKLEEGHASDCSDSDGISLYTPRRLTSIVAEEEWRRREITQSEPVAAYDSEGSGNSADSHHDAITGMTTYGKPPLVQDRKERAIKSAGADPYELSRRLTDLVPPTPSRATFDGTRLLRVYRSPLGRTSPMRPTGEVQAQTDDDDLNTQLVVPGRRFTLHGRALSDGEASQNQR